MTSRFAFSLIAVITMALGFVVSSGTYPAHAAGQTLVVTSAADPTSACPSPPGSQSPLTLRCAIGQANLDCPADAGANTPCDTIFFNIAEGSPGCDSSASTINGRSVFICMISVGNLGSLTLSASNSVIDAYDASPGHSAPGTPSPCSSPPCGAAPNSNAIKGGSNGDNAVPVIQIDGSNAPAGSDGILLTGSDDTVEGLQITDFSSDASNNGGDGIQQATSASSNCKFPTSTRSFSCRETVGGNFIGVVQRGTGAGEAGNSNGVAVIFNNTIGGVTPAAANVIGNNGDGVMLLGADVNTVEGNLIGTNPAGNSAMANMEGVLFGSDANGNASASNTIGGTAAGAGNVISGNTSDGVIDDATSGETIRGNYIGTDTTGTKAVPNGEGITCNPCVLSTSGNSITVGGAASPAGSGAGNVISGNTGYGVRMASGTLQGNLIGTDATGTKALGNGGQGVIVNQGATVGGTAGGVGNVMSGNAGTGLEIRGSGNTVADNYIGTDITGETVTATNGKSLGNGQAGIDVSTFSAETSSGGETIGPGNVVSGNAGFGIIFGLCTVGSVVQGNYIGVDAGGTKPLGNGGDGVGLACALNGGFANHNAIGGTGGVPGGPTCTPPTPCQGNIISANGGDGIYIISPQDVGDSVEGNYIGTDKSGTAAAASGLGNAHDGVHLSSFAGLTPPVGGVIGTTGTNTGNLIVNSGFSGVEMADGASASIRSNAIHDNLQSGSVTTGAAGEIYLAAHDPKTCDATGATSSSGASNDDLPCPANLTYDPSTGKATAETCGGCIVDFYTAKAGGTADENHGGSLQVVGSITAAGPACDPQTTSNPCSDNTQAATGSGTNLPTGLSAITATATITSASNSTVTDTSEFSCNFDATTNKSACAAPTAARATWFRVQRVRSRSNIRHSTSQLRFVWRMADQTSVVGFNLYAGHQKLNGRIIAVHRSGRYVYTLWVLHVSGQFGLHVLLDTGQQELTVPAR